MEVIGKEAKYQVLWPINPLEIYEVQGVLQHIKSEQGCQ